MATTLRTDTAIPFLAHVEQLKQLLVRDLHHMSRDEQLSAAQVMVDAVALLKRNVNSLLPIHRLPPELLTLIFEYAIFRDERTTFADYHPPADGTCCVDIILITHVCHQWRSAALATPRLWTYLDNKQHSARLAAFLSRSQALPVSLQFTGARCADLVRLLKDFGRRLGRLDVADTRGQFKLRSLQLNGSRLECATISANIQEPEPQPGQEGLRTKLTAFERSISSLKGLAVHTSRGHWIPIVHFPNLTHLFMEQHFGRSEGLLLSLRALVANAPRLQALHLCELSIAPPSPPTASESTLQPVSLPHLRLFVCLDFSLDTSLRLLSLLRIPEDSHVYVDHCTLNPADALGIQQLHSSAWLWTKGLNRLEVTIAQDTVRVVAEGDRSGFWIEGYHDPVGLRHWFRQLQLVLPLDSIQSLDFFSGPNGQYHPEDPLQAVLDYLPSLATLRLPGHSVRPTTSYSQLREVMPYTPYSAIHLSSTLTPGDEPALVRCSLLTTLYLEAYIGDSELRRDDEALWDDFEELSHSLVNMLTQRARAGSPLRSLTLRVLQDATKPGPNEDAANRAYLQAIRTMFNDAAGYVDELCIVLGPEGLRESATSRAQWDFADELEKYWIVPDGSRPPFLKELSY